MSHRILALAVASISLVVAASEAAASAQRTFVASFGATANTASNCSIAKPCRAFSEALSVTNAGGEVIVLDSAGYGPVAISQSVSIIAPAGVYAGISVFSGDGITLSTAGIDVVLNGLTINGLGGANGILMTDGSSLRIENCTVTGFTSSATAGINISATAKVFIENTVVAKNNVGIRLDGGANVSISGVKALNNLATGISMEGASNTTTLAAITDSIASGNGIFGFVVLGPGTVTPSSGFPACASCTRKMTVANSVASGNQYGMLVAGADNASTLTVANSVGSNNASIGLWQFNAAILKSAQNNALSDNTTPVSGTLTTGGIIF